VLHTAPARGDEWLHEAKFNGWHYCKYVRDLPLVLGLLAS